MAVYIGPLNVPNYTFLSSEISSSAVPGIARIGAVCLATDTGAWYIVKGDLTLAAYTLPMNAVITGDVEIGAVELKNATDDTRAKVGAVSGLAVSDNGIVTATTLLAGTQSIGTVGRSATSVTPTAQGSTDSWTLVAGSILDTLNSSSVSYSVKNTEVTNSVDYKILAGNTSNIAEAVEIQAAATILAGAYGGYAISIAPWRYYGVYIQSTVVVTPATVTVVGITKG